MKQTMCLQDLSNPILDGVQYTGIFGAVLSKYAFTPTYSQIISASIVDGYMLSRHSDVPIRPKFSECKTNPSIMASAYDAIYYGLVAHDSDIKRFADLCEKNFLGLEIVETVQRAYGEAVEQKVYGADTMQKAYGQDVNTHSLGQIVVTVDNDARQNTTTDSVAPYDTNTYAPRNQSVQNTTAFTDETTTSSHTDTDTRSARTDTETRSTHTDTETKNSHTDTDTKRTILSITARDYYELEKMLIAENIYDEIAKNIMESVCLSLFV